MIIHHVLDSVFSTRSNLAVLRTLQDSKTGLSGRQIARNAGISHRTSLKCLTELESLSIVRRQRGGRDHLFLLNRDHFLYANGIQPLLEMERKYPDSIHEKLKSSLEKELSGMILFGSTARGDENTASDFDLCLILKKGKNKERVETKVSTLAPLLSDQFGIKVSPLYMTKDEFLKKIRQGHALMKQILSEGIVISGESITRIRNGSKTHSKNRSTPVKGGRI